MVDLKNCGPSSGASRLSASVYAVSGLNAICLTPAGVANVAHMRACRLKTNGRRKTKSRQKRYKSGGTSP